PPAGNNSAHARACRRRAPPPAAAMAAATGRCTAPSRAATGPATAGADGRRADSQAPAQVALGEGPADVHAALEAHGLETLAHLTRQHQPFDLVVAGMAFDRLLQGLDPGQAVGQAAIDQEAGQGAGAGPVHAG